MAFDPHKKEHRTHYAEFLKKGGWGQCPVRFIVPEDSGGDLIAMIKNSLIAYYIEREFNIKERKHGV